MLTHISDFFFGEKVVVNSNMCEQCISL